MGDRHFRSTFAATGYGSLRAILRRVLRVVGSLLLGGALAGAPVAAFTGDMLWVTKAALVGVALLIVMKLIPRHDATAAQVECMKHRER